MEHNADLEHCTIRFVDDAGDSDLFPVEQHLGRDMAQGPRRLFAMGRKAAHLCLENAGLHTPVLRGQGGQPLWPSFYHGSIAHTQGLACAALAHQEHCAGLGIDIEAHARRPRAALVEKVCTSAEQAWVLSDSTHVEARLLALISAKEAVYKAFYPLQNIHLGFLDASLLPAEHGYMGTLCKLAGPLQPRGYRFKVLQYKRGEYLFSLVFLPRERS